MCYNLFGDTMKKKVFIIISVLLILLLIIGLFKFFNNDQHDLEIDKKREKVVKNIGVTNDKQVIVKFKNEDKEDSYYLFYITDKGYTQYLYIFHDDKECYDEYIEKYITEPKYSLRYEDDTYLTIVKLSDATNKENINVKDYLLDKYSNKKFEIIK